MTSLYGQKQLTIFDMDHTLIDGDTPNMWFQYLCDKGRLDPDELQAKRDEFNAQYDAGTFHVENFVDFSVGLLRGHTLAELHSWRDEFMQTRVIPKITQKAKDWYRLHKLAGETLILATASDHFLGEAVQQYFGFEHLIAVNLEHDGTSFTGKIIGQPSYKEGKLLRMQSWVAEHGGNLAEATFYSDSHNDLPLLRVVKNPIAVDPDAELLAEAEQKGWKIITKY